MAKKKTKSCGEQRAGEHLVFCVMKPFFPPRKEDVQAQEDTTLEISVVDEVTHKQ